jgi:hypothetical protein
MKNAILPASPFQEVTSIHGGCVTGYKNYKGLTKREHFASMMMQGLLSNPDKDFFRDDLAEEAVALADSLLAALEK